MAWHCSSSVNSPPPWKVQTNCKLSFDSQQHLFYPDKHFMGFYSHLTQFKTKFHVCSLFDFTLHVLQQRCKTYSLHSVTTDTVNGSIWNLLNGPTRMGGTCHAHWLCLSHATYNQPCSFTVFFITSCIIWWLISLCWKDNSAMLLLPSFNDLYNFLYETTFNVLCMSISWLVWNYVAFVLSL